MTGRELLEQLKHFDQHAPSLLDNEIDATTGNNENGNATRILVQMLLPVGDLRVNGAAINDAAELILLITPHYDID